MADAMATIDIAAEVRAALAGLAPGSTSRVSLTDAGARIASRLGVDWFERAVAPLVLAYPGRHLELLLEISDAEPMAVPHPILPALSGQMYAEGRAVGRSSLGTSAPTGDPVRRAISVPGERLLDGSGDFHFIQPHGLKRRIADCVYSELYRRTPLLLDEWRQARNSRVQRARGRMHPLASTLRTAGEIEPAVASQQPVAWFELNWLETGGAE